MTPHLNESEILDYLMTSDFNEGLSSEESRFLLMKFRSHYRSVHCRLESVARSAEESAEKVRSLEERLAASAQEVRDVQGALDVERSRRLTVMERITGKKSKK